MFMLFEFMFPIIFVMVFGMIIFQFVTGIGTWHKNNQSPRLSVSATVVAKRETILDKGIMPSEKVLDFPVDCNTLTGSVNL